jgi:arylsulfatase A-like enzyme
MSSTPLPLFRTVLWFALAVGIVEGLVKFAQMRVLGVPVVGGPHSVWTAAACDAILFLAFTGPFWLATRSWPALARPKAVAFWSLLLFFTALLANLRSLYFVAVLLLAAGLAWQSARLPAGRTEAFLVVMRRTLIPMAALVVCVAVGMVAWGLVRERRALAALPPAPANASNVLLIVLDTVRAESMSLYGSERRTTPNLERFAARGVVFEQAYATAPWTLPSHATMFTGRYHPELDVNWHKALDARWPTLAEALRDRGYATGGMVGNLLYCTTWTGLSRGFDHYDDISALSYQHWLENCGLGRRVMAAVNKADLAWLVRIAKPRKRGEEVVEAFLEWQASIGERPFFGFLNFMDAHDPYDPPRPYDTKFSTTPVGRVVQLEEQRDPDPARLELTRTAYESEIAHLDEIVGALLRELENRGVLDDTLVVITSDHGEQFGEHGLVLHANSLYKQALHVPLVVVHASQVPAGVRVAEPVSLRDLAATIVDLAGTGEATPFPGVSLRGAWSGSPSAASLALAHLTKARNRPDWYPNGTGPMESLVEGRYHYIRDARGAEQLYDVLADPAETEDLATTDRGREIVARMREVVSSQLSLVSRQ